MPVLFVTKFHYIKPENEIKEISLGVMEEEPERNYHWKIYGIDSDNCILTTIYLYDTMEEAVERKKYLDALADLLNTYTDEREYEFYDVMVDQSLLCKAPILMANIGINGIEDIFTQVKPNNNQD